MTVRGGAQQVGMSGEKAMAPFAGTPSLNGWADEPSHRFASTLETEPQSHKPLSLPTLPMLPAAIRSRPKLPEKDGTACKYQIPEFQYGVVPEEVIADTAIAICSWMRGVTAPLCAMLGDSV